MNNSALRRKIVGIARTVAVVIIVVIIIVVGVAGVLIATSGGSSTTTTTSSSSSSSVTSSSSASSQTSATGSTSSGTQSSSSSSTSTGSGSTSTSTGGTAFRQQLTIDDVFWPAGDLNQLTALGEISLSKLAHLHSLSITRDGERFITLRPRQRPSAPNARNELDGLVQRNHLFFQSEAG